MGGEDDGNDPARPGRRATYLRAPARLHARGDGDARPRHRGARGPLLGHRRRAAPPARSSERRRAGRRAPAERGRASRAHGAQRHRPGARERGRVRERRRVLGDLRDLREPRRNPGVTRGGGRDRGGPRDPGRAVPARAAVGLRGGGHRHGDLHRDQRPVLGEPLRLGPGRGRAHRAHERDDGTDHGGHGTGLRLPHHRRRRLRLRVSHGPRQRVAGGPRGLHPSCPPAPRRVARARPGGGPGSLGGAPRPASGGHPRHR